MKVYEAIKDLDAINNLCDFLGNAVENVENKPDGTVVLSAENAAELCLLLLHYEEILKNANLETRK